MPFTPNGQGRFFTARKLLLFHHRACRDRQRALANRKAASIVKHVRRPVGGVPAALRELAITVP